MSTFNEEQILITGANGQLGTALRKKYPKAQFADITELDITDVQSVNNYDWSKIATIINAAAFTNVDGAETPEGRKVAWKVNAQAVANLAKIAQQKDITLIHVSSDYVFDGTTIGPHTEEENFTPLSVYGASKAAGDLAVSTLPKYYIIRTAWVIGEGKNFVRTMLSLAEKKISPTVVSDQIGRLTFTSELVRAINHLISSDSPYGTYNVTNSGPLNSWAEITRQIFALAKVEDLVVTDITTEKYFIGQENIAPRPLNSDMSLQKIHATGFKSTDWQEDLEKYINNNKEDN